MLALAARPMGYKILTWTGGDRSGAADLADEVMHQPFDDPQALEKFCAQVEVATAEFENLPGDARASGGTGAPATRIPIPSLPASTESGKSFLSDHGFGCTRHFVLPMRRN